MDESALLAELPRLRRYARALVGDRAGADDLLQDTLERAWARQASWQSGRPLRPWLFSIMHNLRMDQLRQGEPPPRPLEEVAQTLPAPAGQPDGGLEIRDMQWALGQLPEEQRAVLLLVALEEMSYGDVAHTLDIPLGTVMSRLARGRERLRGLLERGVPSSHLRIVR